jgi:hypothetical protein
VDQTFTSPVFEKLIKSVSKQDGFFTAQQATSAGYSPQNQSYHVKAGHWERHARGIFRLKLWPTRFSDLTDFEIAYLWTSDRMGVPQGVISHGSALIAWNFSSLFQRTRVHVTVPTKFRRRSQCVHKLQLHYHELNDSNIQDKFGFRITSPLRTILDLLTDPRPSIENKHVKEAMEAALLRGYIADHEIKRATLSGQERDLLVALLRKINYPQVREEAMNSLISSLSQMAVID